MPIVAACARPTLPQPTTSTYTRSTSNSDSTRKWEEITIRLVGEHPLCGHHVWNAATALADYLDAHQDLYLDKYMLEIGVGGALASMVAAKNGANHVVVTDYLDSRLLENLGLTAKYNGVEDTVTIVGFVWGHSVVPLLNLLEEGQKFDLIILSDVLFIHAQHDTLLDICQSVISSNGNVLAFYSHHRPHLASRDLEFFSKAAKRHWKAAEVIKKKYPLTFPEDPGDEEVRAMVHGWKLTRSPDVHDDDSQVNKETQDAKPAKAFPSCPSPAYLSATAESPSTTKPNKKTLILDLEGTLVYHPPVVGEDDRHHTYIRPYMPSFIQYLGHSNTAKWLDVMVSSAAHAKTVADMLLQIGFARDNGKWEVLKEVWAREEQGRSVDEYHNKQEIVKDLADVVDTLYSIPRDQIDEYTARNVVLLDDTTSIKRTRLQPYNLIRVGKYGKMEHKADLETLRRTKEDNQSPRKHRKVDDDVSRNKGELIEFEPTLLAVVGMLEQGVKQQGNIAAWIRTGGIGNEEEEDYLARWVTLGVEVLKSMGIKIESGLTD